ncbi:hypothetical protein GCM10018790_51400 [Kitasatospora xanthocidica]|nr:hypothetical protein GCM10018790_51400 [Kitasatospora xanthocidica]
MVAALRSGGHGEQDQGRTATRLSSATSRRYQTVEAAARCRSLPVGRAVRESGFGYTIPLCRRAVADPIRRGAGGTPPDGRRFSAGRREQRQLFPAAARVAGS